MTSDVVIAAALASLAGPGHAHSEAVQRVPKEPGLYALYGDDDAWSQFRLEPTFYNQPLYVGKAERSLKGRDVGTHFAVGKTGWSTVRRSLAALLADDLALVAAPRNVARPDGSANFALDAQSEARLSEWMAQRLSLATWRKPYHVSLDEIETAVVRRLRPPLNLDKVGESREPLRQARKRMAEAARAWRPLVEPDDDPRSSHPT
jgi:hypothetical protein